MMKIVLKSDQNQDKSTLKACKKVEMSPNKADFVAYDKFLFSLLFVLAIEGKTVHLFSADKKKPETFPISDVENVLIDKKTDVNLYLKGGRIINLTSINGMKGKNVKLVESLRNEINKLK